jgi:hypothetical protein
MFTKTIFLVFGLTISVASAGYSVASIHGGMDHPACHAGEYLFNTKTHLLIELGGANGCKCSGIGLYTCNGGAHKNGGACASYGCQKA